MRAREGVPADLEGRVALVLGAGAIGPGWGIGKAVACRFAAAGATVVAADREIAAAEEAVRDIGSVQGSGGHVEPAAVDVLDDRALAALVAEVDQRHGRLDVLYCNVGLGKAGSGDNTSADDFRRIAEANIVSVHVAAQAALPSMRARRAGVILATSTVVAYRHPGYQHLAYGATKAGLNQLIRLLAVENGPYGVRANTVVAGLIDTPRIAKTLAGAYGGSGIEEMRAARARQVPLGRMGDPFDVADAALFLASDRARYVTGTEVLVDGGLIATVRQPE